jgi:hypothetical protein
MREYSGARVRVVRAKSPNIRAQVAASVADSVQPSLMSAR